MENLLFKFKDFVYPKWDVYLFLVIKELIKIVKIHMFYITEDIAVDNNIHKK